MTALDLLKQMLRERKQFPRGSLDHEWRSAAARKYYWITRRIPRTEWPE